MARRVVILHTGGTLGMRPRDPDRALAPDEFGTTVLEHVPELHDIAEVEPRVLFNIDSSDVGPAHWSAIAAAVESALGRGDGVVVTHGTDAMAYTAAALSFLLRGLPGPVVLTGSQRPLADPRSDARGNLVGAVDLATRDIPEVAIYFQGALLRGNRTTKDSTFAYGAFRSPNLLPLAEVGTGVRSVTPPLRPDPPLRVEGGFDPRVAAVRLVPGQSSAVLRTLVGTEVRGVLVEAFGSGNLPVIDRGIADAVRELAASDRLVAIASQAPHGSVDLGRYVGGRLARDCGAVGVGDMTREAAAVKMMYVLGSTASIPEARDALVVPIAGEMGGEA